MYRSKKFLTALLAGLFLSMSTHSVQAAEQGQAEEEEESKSTFMSQSTYNRISRSHKAIEEGKYQEALDELLDLAEDVKDRDYEYAVTLQTIGYVYISQEKWELAADYMKRALDLNALPAEAEKSVIYTLAQIYATLGRYQDTINLMTDWFKTAKNPPPDAYIITANSYAMLENYQAAYPYVQKAIEKAEKPREDWYKLALAIQFELNKFREAAQTLEVLVSNWPDKYQYWKQLSGVYIQLEQDTQALATLALAYEKGLLDDKSEDLLNLARLYMLNDVPYKGAVVLKSALDKGQVERTRKNYELLSQAWVQAREYKEGVVALKKAAELANEAELYVRAAQLEMSLANWEGAKEAARRAVEIGGMESDDTGKAWLLLGTAAAEQKDFDTALEAFNKARGYPETRKRATQWVSFVQTERQVSTLN